MYNNEAIYIPNLQSKDIYVSNNVIGNNIGYNLKNKEGAFKLKKFNYSLDWSKEQEQLSKLYKSTFRRKDFDFSVTDDNRLFSIHVINVNFQYSVKSFNKIDKVTYVKFGYDSNELVWDDCLAFDDGELVGVKVGTPIENVKDLSEYESRQLTRKDKDGNTTRSLFSSESIVKNKEEVTVYKIDENENKTIKTKDDLRKDLYVNGFICNGIEYVRYMRSAGASRQGKCLFINKRLFEKVHKWDMKGIDLTKDVELAPLETYISLQSSSSIGKIYIDPKSILIIPEYKSLFTDTVIATTKDENDRLHTDKADVEISNNIWDGQALIDVSAMGLYKEYGMVLLRERMFKGCCFSTNLQTYFKHNGITEISQLNGFTKAERVEDIKLVITDSCNKYLKFGTVNKWLDMLDGWFYVVKTEHETKFYDNKRVQAHYQLLNTLQLTKDEIRKILQPIFDYIEGLNSDIDVFKYHIKYGSYNLDGNDEHCNPLLTNEDKVNALMMVKDFDKTELYYNYKRDIIENYYDNVKRGNILIPGCYAVLFGNPLSMLKRTIDKFDGTSEFKPGELMTTYYDYNKKIVGCRSPHVAAGNLLLATNTHVDDINTYFNLTDNIVCVNSINDNLQMRLSGCDFDSDSMLITDEPIIIEATHKNYGKFLVPTSQVEGTKTLYKYTSENLAKLDSKNADLTQLIGEVINFSQILNSKIWHDLNNGKSFDEIFDIYKDVCQLDILSGLCIDMAKKDFGKLSIKTELKEMRAKYMNPDYNMTMIVKGKTKLAIPSFFKHLDKAKGYKKDNYKEYDTAMCYLEELVKKNRSSDNKPEFIGLNEIFKCESYDIKKVDYTRHINPIIKMVKQAQTKIDKERADYNALPAKTKDDAKCLYANIRLYKQVLFNYVNSVKINEHTLYKILEMIEDEKHSEYKSLLFFIMINLGNNTFTSLLHDKQNVEYQLIEDESGDTLLHNISHKKIQKNA